MVMQLHIEPQYTCDACDGPIVGPPIIYRSKVVCSITCEDNVDRTKWRRDVVSQMVEEWCTRLPRRLR
jgi:hypothetical protein